ncbi:MAG: hypothetical protein LUD03_05860 [Firmicutes bacterium]|nr:hypothetical protein [Bacillota bacterium]
MEDVIRRIISIEEKAQDVFSDAKKAETEFDERVEEDSRSLSMKIKTRAANKCAQVKEAEEKAANEKIAGIVKKSEAQIAEIEEKYRKNKDKWVDDIVNRIVG